MSATEKVTPDDLLDSMAAADVLDVFLRLPAVDRENFSRWIGNARDDDSLWRRIDALVLALRIGPLRADALITPTK